MIVKKPCRKECLLSVAMIVKDEELNIRRALESASKCADEIVVVDTGSTDRTPEIAKEYTDKVYFHEWKNDFSEARNFSLKFPGCEWVMILDADEELSPEFIENIRGFLENLPKDVNTVYVPSVDFYDAAYANTGTYPLPRIFRNGTVYYERKVHNQPVYKEKAVSFKYPVFHYGYIQSKSLFFKKYSRSRPLIVEEIRTTEDPLMKLYYQLQLIRIEHAVDKLYRVKALGRYVMKRILEVPLEELPTLAADVAIFIHHLMSNPVEKEESLKVIKKVKKFASNHPDLYYAFGKYYFLKKDFKKTRENFIEFLKYLEVYKKDPARFPWHVFGETFYQEVCLLLAGIAFREGRYLEFSRFLKGALKGRSNVNTISALKFLLQQVDEADSKEKIIGFMREIQVIVRISRESNFRINWKPVLEKLIEIGLDDVSVLEEITPFNRVEEMLLERLKEKRDLLKDLIFAERKPLDVVKEYNEAGLLFVFHIYFEMATSINDYRALLKILRDVYKDEAFSSDVRALSLALTGDVLLKLGNLNAAIKSYREALATSSSLAEILKIPVTEITAATSIKSIAYTGFDALKDKYLIVKDFFIDLDNVLSRDLQKIAYLISDHPLAKYISSIVFLKDGPKKAIELLESINPDERRSFPLYWERLAEAYALVGEFERSRVFHYKALVENPALADMVGGGSFLYEGVYPEIKMKRPGEIVHVLNISKYFPTWGMVNPVKIWRKDEKGCLFAESIPVDGILKEIFSRYEKTDFMPYKFLKILNDVVYFIGSEFIIGGKEFLKEHVENLIKNNIESGFNKRTSGAALVLLPEVMLDEEILRVAGKYKKIAIVHLWALKPDGKLLANPLVYFLRSKKCFDELLKEKKQVFKNSFKLADNLWLLFYEREEQR